MKKDTIKKVFKLIGKYRIMLYLSIILAGVSVLLQLYVPILFGQAIDGIIGKGKVDFSIITVYMAKIFIFIM